MHVIEAESIREPKWVGLDGTRISCKVKFNHMQNEHEFIAYAFDCEKHGRDIWQRCVNGEFGEIQPSDKNTENINYAEFLETKNIDEFSSFIDEHNSENLKKSFRGMVIIWGAQLDLTLGNVLVVYKSSHPDINIKSNTLNQKINLAYKYNLIDKEQRNRCNYIRHIRNEFAHNWNPSLNDEKLKESFKALYCLDHSGTFKFIEDMDFLVQMIFTGSCSQQVLSIKNTAFELNNKL